MRRESSQKWMERPTARRDGLASEHSFSSCPRPKQAGGESFRVASVSLGESHTLVLDARGVAFSCGRGHLGQLGRGQPGHPPKTLCRSPPPRVCPTAPGSFRITASCLPDRHGSPADSDRLAPVKGFAGERVQLVAACGNRSLCVTAKDICYSWGKSWAPRKRSAAVPPAQKKAAAATSQATPERFAFGGFGLSMNCLHAVDLGHSAGVGLDIVGQVYSWGHGALHTQRPDRKHPDGVPSLIVGKIGAGGKSTTVTAIGAGRAHRLAVTSEGQPYTWGRNEAGQLGLAQDPGFAGRDQLGLDYAFAAMAEPVRIDVFSGHTVERVWCGGDCSFAWTRAGTLFSWGANTFGQLGQGHERPIVPSPQTVVGMDCSKVTELACGGSHTVAICDGVVWAWGRGVHGQLGFGGFAAKQRVPRLALNLGVNAKGTPVAVACGDNHSAVLTDGGLLYTFGSNVFGQLGHAPPSRRPQVGPPRAKSANALARGRRPKAMDLSMADLEQTYRRGGGSFGCRLSKSQMIRFHTSLNKGGARKPKAFLEDLHTPKKMVAFGGI